MKFMQDGKRVKLTNQCLINLRFNLRRLIESALNKRNEGIYEEIFKIQRARNEAQNAEKEELNNQLIILRKKNSLLDDFFQKSILRCGTCHTLEGDRIYYKRFDKCGQIFSG